MRTSAGSALADEGNKYGTALLYQSEKHLDKMPWHDKKMEGEAVAAHPSTDGNTLSESAAAARQLTSIARLRRQTCKPLRQ